MQSLQKTKVALLIVSLIVGLFFVLSLTACNTIVGRGEDVSSIGYAMGADKDNIN